LYTPVARIVVPARNAVASALIAAAAALGQLEILMIMPMMVLGPFFFLGLQFRTALVTVLLTVASFVAGAVFYELPTPVALRACAFLLLTVAACAVAALQVERWSRRSFVESRLIAEFALHDALTGTKNRRVFDEHLARLWQQARDDRRSLAILLIDVDHFKAYNDRYGHQAGDETLRRVAETLQYFVRRPLDVLARYGGEEFAVILYDTDAGYARDMAERMRRAVSALGIEHRGSRDYGTLTISIGIAVLEPTRERQPEGALQLADEALYAAKTSGRNKVELKDEDEHKLLVTGVFSKISRGASTSPH
jgi:diguanylate cyclase (GGDEF)-like protein